MNDPEMGVFDSNIFVEFNDEALVQKNPLEAGILNYSLGVFFAIFRAYSRK